MRADLRVQVQAFGEMHGEVLDMIDEYGALFRDIITGFENKFGMCPTADDLLWIAGERTGKNPRD